MQSCFHCGQTLDSRTFSVKVGGELRGFCCPGCAAAADMIWRLGLEAYYRFRTETPDPVGSERNVFAQFDDPSVRANFVRREGPFEVAYLDIQGLHCAACGWLVDRTLQAMEGIVRSSVNSATGRACIVFDPARTRLSRLLATIAAVGYRPAPIASTLARTDPDRVLDAPLRRLAVAGLGMMQVMMFAVALYTGAAQGMDAVMQSYMRYVSLVVATPVMIYSGWPFYAGALRALKARSITMDVPVTLGLALAYGASVVNTGLHRGEVYFDSVTMFIFFLTLARLIELMARRRCLNVTESLSRLLPTMAHRLRADGLTEDVPVSLLTTGDTILVRNGEIVPADATIRKGNSTLDESMLTGESTPLERRVGERVLAGSLNSGEPIECSVVAAGAGTVLSSIVDLLLRAQTERPKAVRDADRMAGRFLVRVLVSAALVFVAWQFVNPAHAFSSTLAVLVVACPCALSLGPLIGLASATSALARRGVLVSHPDAIEGLAAATAVVFDKTGTLTAGRLKLTAVRTAGDRDTAHCLELAAALEVGFEHPVARALANYATPECRATQVKMRPGAGVEGWINGKLYRLGTRAYALGTEHEAALDVVGDAAIVLSESHRRLASFELADTLRPEAPHVVQQLKEQGLKSEILSGDALDRVTRIARACDIPQYAARCTPDQKLERVRAQLQNGCRVAVIGDGINDAPVLGGASVSIAMGRGSAIAQASADLVLVRDSLAPLPFAFSHARRAQRIMRQNMVWAAGYNFVSIPLAAIGWVPPWAAALGMSLSSILVVLNSLRLNRRVESTLRTAEDTLTPLEQASS